VLVDVVVVVVAAPSVLVLVDVVAPPSVDVVLSVFPHAARATVATTVITIILNISKNLTGKAAVLTSRKTCPKETNDSISTAKSRRYQPNLSRSLRRRDRFNSLIKMTEIAIFMHHPEIF
jgi:hypothetical protein